MPLSLTQSLIQGDYELTSRHHSFSCQISLICHPFVYDSDIKRELLIRQKLSQVDGLGVIVLCGNLIGRINVGTARFCKPVLMR